MLLLLLSYLNLWKFNTQYRKNKLAMCFYTLFGCFNDCSRF